MIELYVSPNINSHTHLKERVKNRIKTIELLLILKY